MVGKVFADRYKIIKLIGSGGMAEVYLAEDIMLNKSIAIKILRKELINNRESVRYFKNEAEAISHLSHPNIVEVYDVGMAEGHPYIVMELIDGKTLKDIIRDKAPLSPYFAIHVMEGILSALIHSHKKGVIHRDIKPHNIMVNREGEVKVMDFGIARITDKNSTMTLTTDIVGSVHYLSPEQAAGNKITELADVYSSGIVFYEMLTGKLPYEGQNPVSVAVNHIQGGLIPPKDLVPDIPQELENIVLKATMRDPKKRFKSALEMNICIEKVRVLMEEGKINQVARIPLEEPIKDKKELKDNMKKGPKSKTQKPKRNMKKTAIIAGAALLLLVVAISLIVGLTSGEEKVVPDVAGMTEADAKVKLEAAGFKYQSEGVFSTEVEVGKVVEQDPRGNTVAKTNKVVKLKISKGKDKVDIPSVSGLTEKEATGKLQSAGFKVVVEKAYSDTVPSGQVISQSPSSGEKAMPETEVTIVVSQGKEITTVDVPDLVGQTLESAENSLASSNLTVGAVTNEETADYLPGQVISQGVAPGTTVNAGTSVSLVVAKEFSPKVYRLTYKVTNPTGSPRNLEITVTDKKGSRTITDTMSGTATEFSKDIQYFGSGTLVFRDNGTVVDTIQLQ